MPKSDLLHYKNPIAEHSTVLNSTSAPVVHCAILLVRLRRALLFQSLPVCSYSFSTHKHDVGEYVRAGRRTRCSADYLECAACLLRV